MASHCIIVLDHDDGQVFHNDGNMADSRVYTAKAKSSFLFSFFCGTAERTEHRTVSFWGETTPPLLCSLFSSLTAFCFLTFPQKVCVKKRTHIKYCCLNITTHKLDCTPLRNFYLFTKASILLSKGKSILFKVCVIA